MRVKRKRCGKPGITTSLSRYLIFLFKIVACISYEPFQQEQIIFQDVNISVMAILNDSTGTLMSCAGVNRFCRVGIIIGESGEIPELVRAVRMKWKLFIDACITFKTIL